MSRLALEWNSHIRHALVAYVRKSRVIRRLWQPRPPPNLPHCTVTSRYETVLTCLPAILGVTTARREMYAEWFLELCDRDTQKARALDELVIVLNNQAQRRWGSHFKHCDAAYQDRMVQNLIPASRSSRAGALIDVIFHRRRVRLNQQIRHPLLGHFGRTEAWIWAGYRSWPGEPQACQTSSNGDVPKAED